MSQSISTEQEKRDELILKLKEAQSRSGYISREVITALAESFSLPVNEVYGIASFYSFLSVKPLGRNVIRVCKSLPCYLKSSELIIETVGKELGIKPGESTQDRRFSFELANCIGCCDGAPAMMINQDAHTDLTPEKIADILKKYK